MPINMTLGEFRQLEALAGRAKEKAAKEIAREADAWSIFDALDQIPEKWPDKYGEIDDFCRKCLNKIINKPSVKKLLGPKWDGPHRYAGDEGESQRNCHSCGCPLPWALLEYGMESEVAHFESEYAEPMCDNAWYWLWRIADECLTCEEYLNTYGQRVREVLVRLVLKKASN